MSTDGEIPLVFEVQGSPVLGILHVPAEPARVGLIMVAAGGPQYHVGCCRQLLTWARRFAHQGISVLRFDYRGMGDSGGEFRGFEHVDDDLWVVSLGGIFRCGIRIVPRNRKHCARWAGDLHHLYHDFSSGFI